MHKSSLLRMEWFAKNYLKEKGLTILDVGSQDVNGSYKHLALVRINKYNT